MADAGRWIERLGLQPHPEGGYYRQTYRAAETIRRDHLPERFGGHRAFSTAIYFLLQGSDFSALHRIRSDEVWHFYDGSPLTVHVIDPGGEYRSIRLGRDLDAGQVPQAVVPAGDLFGASLEDPDGFALVGCTVAPGFDFDDFELPARADLLAQYPQHRELIARLSR
jgi:predicted cupin superfamily sugar epimerase